MTIFNHLLIAVILVSGYDTCKKEGEPCKYNFECCAMLNCVKLTNLNAQNNLDYLITQSNKSDDLTDKLAKKNTTNGKNTHLANVLQEQQNGGPASMCLQHKTIKLYQ